MTAHGNPRGRALRIRANAAQYQGHVGPASTRAATGLRSQSDRAAQHPAPALPDSVVDLVGSRPEAAAGCSVFEEGVGVPGVVPILEAPVPPVQPVDPSPPGAVPEDGPDGGGPPFPGSRRNLRLPGPPSCFSAAKAMVLPPNARAAAKRTAAMGARGVLRRDKSLFPYLEPRVGMVGPSVII